MNKREFAIGDKVLSLITGKSLIAGALYNVLPAAHGPSNYLGFSGSTTLRIKTKVQTNYFSKTSFILAETDSVERSLEHIQKDMWIKERDNPNIEKVDWVRLQNNIQQFKVRNGWLYNTNIEKIYFYDPTINKKADDDKKRQIEELRTVIMKAEKVRDELIESMGS